MNMNECGRICPGLRVYLGATGDRDLFPQMALR